MFRYILITFLFSTSLYAACPESLKTSVHVDELLISDRADEDFKNFSQKEFSSQFILKKEDDGCLYVSADRAAAAPESTGKKLYLFIGNVSSGHKFKVQLNGYSPKGKLFEIRALVSGEAEIPLDIDAGFFDASGPAKEYLGKAKIRVE